MSSYPFDKKKTVSIYWEYRLDNYLFNKQINHDA